MDHWIEKKISFKFQLGEYTLFSWVLPAQILNKHFTEMPSVPLEPEKLPEQFTDSLAVYVMRSHPIEADIPRLTNFAQVIRYVPAQYKRYWTDLDGNFEDYLKKFSAKSRSTLTRKIKKFATFSDGETQWQEYVHPNEMETFYQLALDVSTKTYQERLLGCGLPAEKVFYDEMLKLSEQGMARGYILFHQEKPVAYIYCPIHNGIALYEYVGHDPEFKRWSPGTILQYYALTCLFESDNMKIFDFTEGEGAHKAFFSTHNQSCADIYYFQRTIKNRIILATHTGLNAVSESIVNLLEKIGLKAFIKKILRSAA